MPTLYILFILILVSVSGCQLGDNRINGQYVSVGSETPPSPPAPPAPPVFSLANSSAVIADNTAIKNTPVDITISTRDQYGDLIYNPTAVVNISISGGTADGWLTDLVDNADGTYTAQFFSEAAGSAKTLTATIDGDNFPTSDPTIVVDEPRLAFTGNSHRSASIAARTVVETDSPGWTLTGECDVDLGDVSITSPTATDIDVPCDTAGGGTFTADFNYDTTEPYLSSAATAAVIHFYIKQSTLQPKYTWIYKTLTANPPILITDLAGLQAMVDNDATVFYILDANINAVGANNWTPIGDVGIVDFIGVFDGNGHTIDGLNQQSAISSSLFARFKGQVSNVKLTNVDLRGSSNAGGIAGAMFTGGSIRHVSVSGHLESTSNGAGGISGFGGGSGIEYAKFSGSIVASRDAGGISATSNSAVYVISSGTVAGGEEVGGIIGDGNLFINNAFSDATVSSLAATSDHGAAGIGDRHVVQNSYFTGSVTAPDNVGGIIKHSWGKGIGVYSTASVVATGAATKVGLTASQPPVFGSNVVFNLDTATCTPACTNTEGNSKTISELQQRSTFENWDFYNVWRIDEGSDTPRLRWMDYQSEYIP